MLCALIFIFFDKPLGKARARTNEANKNYKHYPQTARNGTSHQTSQTSYHPFIMSHLFHPSLNTIQTTNPNRKGMLKTKPIDYCVTNLFHNFSPLFYYNHYSKPKPVCQYLFHKNFMYRRREFMQLSSFFSACNFSNLFRKPANSSKFQKLRSAHPLFSPDILFHQ